jgi:hypothetical protein
MNRAHFEGSSIRLPTIDTGSGAECINVKITSYTNSGLPILCSFIIHVGIYFTCGMDSPKWLGFYHVEQLLLISNYIRTLYPGIVFCIDAICIK